LALVNVARFDTVVSARTGRGTEQP